MKKQMRAIFLCTIATIFPLAPVFAAAPGDHFSADVVSSTPEGTMSVKMYSSGQKSRMEMAEHLMIVRKDLGVMWMVMPSQGIYMEQPLTPMVIAQTSREMPGEIKREPRGSETVDGKPAQKFEITYETAGRRDSVYQWMGADNFPVRTQAIDGSWTVDFKNISSAPQPESLFEVPAGLQKMEIPSMGNLMAAAGAPQEQ